MWSVWLVTHVSPPLAHALKRENTFYAHFIQSGQRTQWRDGPVCSWRSGVQDPPVCCRVCSPLHAHVQRRRLQNGQEVSSNEQQRLQQLCLNVKMTHTKLDKHWPDCQRLTDGEEFLLILRVHELTCGVLCGVCHFLPWEKRKELIKKKCTLYDYVHVCSPSVWTYIYSIYTVIEWKYNVFKCFAIVLTTLLFEAI